MSDPSSQPPTAWTILAIALISLIWQWLRARRSPRAGGLLPEAPFWVSASAWVLLGLLLTGRPNALVWQGLLAWLLPALGLLAATLIHLLRSEVPRVLAEDLGSPAENQGGPESAVRLDAEDQRLVQRLVSLRRRRAIDLMLPLSQVATLREESRLQEAILLLRAGAIWRIPVLDQAGTHLRGVIDCRDLIGIVQPQAGEQSPDLNEEKASSVCQPVPEVYGTQSAADLVEALRRNGHGVVAVVDGDRRVLGFVAWDQVFQVLLGRRPDRVGL